MGFKLPTARPGRVGVLMAGALVGVVGILPYAFTLLDELPGGVKGTLPSWWILLPLQVIQSMVLIGAATALGLWLGPKVGLGVPLLYRLVNGDRGSPLAPAGAALSQRRAGSAGRRGHPAARPLGVRTAAGRSRQRHRCAQATGLARLMASFYGAIPEELLMRLGLMTLLVWVGARLTRSAVPSPAGVWTAIVATALLFGAGHLPTTAAMLPLTPLVIARALLLNGIGESSSAGCIGSVACWPPCWPTSAPTSFCMSPPPACRIDGRATGPPAICPRPFRRSNWT